MVNIGAGPSSDDTATLPPTNVMAAAPPAIARPTFGTVSTSVPVVIMYVILIEHWSCAQVQFSRKTVYQLGPTGEP